MVSEILRPCETYAGWLPSFGDTHRCMFSAGHTGAHEYVFLPGAVTAGALSLDEQAAEYVAMFEERADLTDAELAAVRS